MILVSSCSYRSISTRSGADIVYKKKDQRKLEEVLHNLKSEKDKPVSELMVLTGKQFLETPYVGYTVEIGKNEQLVINLRGLDCTTFAENCLAISRTMKSDKLTFEQFTKELEGIRYRKGVLDGYPSRLHYFSDWIYENEQKELIKDVTQGIGDIPYPIEVNFMSTHPESYKRIKKDMTLASIIAEQERSISTRKMHYIPEERLAEFEDQLQGGDIAGITTSIEGMDIQHVVILVRVKDRVHIMHASSKAEKVIISEETLEDYLFNNEKATGIMVARPEN
ncbi:MAG: N-acetylmuramoyl-L-alanine amidase-like domain-containing protein [Bacteroidota bacterium]